MEIVGHRDVLRKLEKLSKLKVIPPLLFYGQFGIGKASSALYFCALCNLNQSEKIFKLVHPDIIILTNGEVVPYGPRPTDFDNLKNISIEQVRSLKVELQKPPIYAKRRFVIIMDADMLTIEAQNSLLKILEEHEKRTTFILITSNYTKILPTIISRTLKIPFKSLSFEDFKQYKYDWKYELEFLYEISEGSIGIAKQLNDYPIYDWIECLKEKNFSKILINIKTSKDLLNFLRIFRYYFKKLYIEEGKEIYYKILKKSIEIEDIVRRYGSIEGSLISLFSELI
ncbi:MAG: hypothetical protein ABIL89_07430 [candidate division WOR-3 bacterium]|jgi:DNA polymerase-3 subunit delta'